MKENSKNKQFSNKEILALSWTNFNFLKKFTTDTGRILPKKYTGLTSKQQRHISRIIKRARNMLVLK